MLKSWDDEVKRKDVKKDNINSPKHKKKIEESNGKMFKYAQRKNIRKRKKGRCVEGKGRRGNVDVGKERKNRGEKLRESE